ncbi:MAG: DUF308 domain-containing protein [Bacteroidales bacterium]|jgi:uncharacterized membrane protein HdeD (DUF308 family)|nr:DUF308 domain-containing protein [Bacteroidales bacterium]
MNSKLLDRLETSKKAIRFWWGVGILGIVMILIGIIMFFTPTISYIILSSIIGIIIFASGISNLALSINTWHVITGKVWIFANGIVEIILGFILMFSLAVSELILPILLGLWVLFKAINIIGVSDEMNIMEIPGAGWTLLLGIMTMICAFGVLSQPLIFGADAVVVWIGITLIMLGISCIIYSLQLKNMHKHFK